MTAMRTMRATAATAPAQPSIGNHDGVQDQGCPVRGSSSRGGCSPLRPLELTVPVSILDPHERLGAPVAVLLLIAEATRPSSWPIIGGRARRGGGACRPANAERPHENRAGRGYARPPQPRAHPGAGLPVSLLLPSSCLPACEAWGGACECHRGASHRRAGRVDSCQVWSHRSIAKSVARGTLGPRRAAPNLDPH